VALQAATALFTSGRFEGEHRRKPRPEERWWGKFNEERKDEAERQHTAARTTENPAAPRTKSHSIEEARAELNEMVRFCTEHADMKEARRATGLAINLIIINLDSLSDEVVAKTPKGDLIPIIFEEYYVCKRGWDYYYEKLRSGNVSGVLSMTGAGNYPLAANRLRWMHDFFQPKFEKIESIIKDLKPKLERAMDVGSRQAIVRSLKQNPTALDSMTANLYDIKKLYFVLQSLDTLKPRPSFSLYTTRSKEIADFFAELGVTLHNLTGISYSLSQGPISKTRQAFLKEGLRMARQNFMILLRQGERLCQTQESEINQADKAIFIKSLYDFYRDPRTKDSLHRLARVEPSRHAELLIIDPNFEYNFKHPVHSYLSGCGYQWSPTNNDPSRWSCLYGCDATYTQYNGFLSWNEHIAHNTRCDFYNVESSIRKQDRLDAINLNNPVTAEITAAMMADVANRNLPKRIHTLALGAHKRVSGAAPTYQLPDDGLWLIHSFLTYRSSENDVSETKPSAAKSRSAAAAAKSAAATKSTSASGGLAAAGAGGGASNAAKETTVQPRETNAITSATIAETFAAVAIATAAVAATIAERVAAIAAMPVAATTGTETAARAPVRELRKPLLAQVEQHSRDAKEKDKARLQAQQAQQPQSESGRSAAGSTAGGSGGAVPAQAQVEKKASNTKKI